MVLIDNSDTNVGELARSLDCLTEAEFILLAKITPLTAQKWRKSGVGPVHILFGNRFLYPRAAIADYFKGLILERRPRRPPALNLL